MVRLVALDVARAVAIIGMLAVNVGPRDDTGLAAWVIRAAHGRASILFVLLAGVGVALLTRRALAGGPPRRSALFWRAGVLLVLGLVLQLLDHDVSVILATYAVLFAVAAALVRLPDKWLLSGAATTATAGPVLWILAQRPAEFAMDAPRLTDSPLSIAGSILVSGPYPAIVWAAPFLFGMWLGRQQLSARRVQLTMLWAGSVAAVGGMLASRLLVLLLGQPGERVGLDRLISAVGHSQMPLWLLSATGSAVAVLAALLLLVPHLGRLVAPLTALGQLSLTVYVAHLVVLVSAVRPGPWSATDGLAVTAVITIVATALAVAWRTTFARGPLETVLRIPRRLA
ncbi:DUF418 domain-containing protein [Georgenia alba]|uniref:DUF418 domain-containing protein n=1 Tax=Georgenia alba TaxID=2233858 RepID=A0ABW2QC18_9MICO